MSVSTLFDKLRKQESIPSDSALARELEVTASDISKSRKRDVISDRVILRIHEYLGWPVREIRLELEQTAPHQYHDNPAGVSTTEANQ
jgi:hypothetical protein